MGEILRLVEQSLEMEAQMMTPEDRKKEKWGYFVYGGWILIWFVLEMLGWKKKAPWPTLSRTSWNLEQRWPGAMLILYGGLTILRKHIVDRWPNRKEIRDEWT